MDQRPRPGISAIGISDAVMYADILEKKLNYKNTYLHTDPYLDLCDTESTSRYSGLDIIICSDVLEHTKETPNVVLRNMLGMLKPGGVIILSAPTYQMPTTIEWYPGAKSVEVIPNGDDYHVAWTTIRDVDYIDTNPSFHGGAGNVLEMRVISHSALLADAVAIGYEAKTREFDPNSGYVWPIVKQYPNLDAEMDGRVVVLRRPKSLVLDSGNLMPGRFFGTGDGTALQSLVRNVR